MHKYLTWFFVVVTAIILVVYNFLGYNCSRGGTQGGDTLNDESLTCLHKDNLNRLFNTLDQAGSKKIQAFIRILSQLTASQRATFLKTSIVRAMKHPTGSPYCMILVKYREESFRYFPELEQEGFDKLLLLQVFGAVYISAPSGGWIIPPSSGMKDFLFDKLILGLGYDARGAQKVSSSGVTDSCFNQTVRSFALALTKAVNDADSIPYLRKLLARETCYENINRAKELISRL
jgi:hypothetical protein